jgi:hypothetical protein
MRDALEKAGILLPDQRLRKIAVAAVKAGDRSLKRLERDPEAALCLVPVGRLSEWWDAYLNDVEREVFGLVRRASQSSFDSQQGHDRPSDQIQGRASQASHDSHEVRDRPATEAEPNGASHMKPASHTSLDRPVRSAPATKIGRAAALAVARTVLDNFAIIDRNGERLPIGDIYVSTYPRLIRMTAKRAWRNSREHALLQLLKAESERIAVYIPSDAKTRDIFDPATVERLLNTATDLALPKLEAGVSAERRGRQDQVDREARDVAH